MSTEPLPEREVGDAVYVNYLDAFVFPGRIEEVGSLTADNVKDSPQLKAGDPRYRIEDGSGKSRWVVAQNVYSTKEAAERAKTTANSVTQPVHADADTRITVISETRPTNFIANNHGTIIVSL